MNDLTNKTVFITGASSGIGQACAAAFAARGANLIISSRGKDRLEKCRQELIEQHPSISVQAVPLDVRKRQAVTETCAAILAAQPVDILVNNAGLALGLEKLHQGNADDWEEMIDTNIKGLLYLTRAVVADMVNRQRPGHVINIGSLAGVAAYPNGAVYCATKAAVKLISDGLRLDLVDQPIRVTNIEPGMVETNFSVVRFHGDRERASNVYRGFVPLTAQDIAECVLFAASAPAHVQIQQILVTPTHQSSALVAWRKPQQV